MSLVVLPEKCNGCQECLAACPFWAIEMEQGVARILENCTECGICLPVCPENAIQSPGAEPALAQPRAQSGETAAPATAGGRGRQVWAVVEPVAGTFDRESLAVLGQARSLAEEMGGRCVAVQVGENGSPTELIAGGADEALALVGEGLAAYSPGAWAVALALAIRERDPEAVLFPGSVHGEELSARVAGRLGLPLASRCTQVSIGAATGELEGTHPVYGEGVLATVGFGAGRPALASLAVDQFRPPRPDPTREGRTARLPVSIPIPAGWERVIGQEKIDRQPSLAEAPVIVCGGAQMGSGEAFAALADLARALGGVLAGTQEAYKRGWVDASLVVDASRGHLAPRLYVACGDYGSPGHLAAISGAGYILAISPHPEAAIFQSCDLGLVGDPAGIARALVGLLGMRIRQ